MTSRTVIFGPRFLALFGPCASSEHLCHPYTDKGEGQKNGDRNISDTCPKLVFFCPHFSVRFVVVKWFIRVIGGILQFGSGRKAGLGKSAKSVNVPFRLIVFVSFVSFVVPLVSDDQRRLQSAGFSAAATGRWRGNWDLKSPRQFHCLRASRSISAVTTVPHFSAFASGLPSWS